MALDKSLAGRRVKLVRCMDPYTNLPSGSEGTVVFIDDVGTLHVKWDTGSNLGLCPADGDVYELLP